MSNSGVRGTDSRGRVVGSRLEGIVIQVKDDELEADRDPVGHPKAAVIVFHVQLGVVVSR